MWRLPTASSPSAVALLCRLMAAIIIGMKIFLKTLKGEKTEFEVQPEDTVGTLKQKMKDAQGHDPQLQKLIAFGKIMEDSKSLTDYNLKENDQIVLMVSKPKPQSRPLEPPPFLAAQRQREPVQRTFRQAPPQLQGPEFEQAVQMIMELGMPRDQVEAALRTARGNPNLAMELLMRGGPITRGPGAVPQTASPEAAPAGNLAAQAGNGPF